MLICNYKLIRLTNCPNLYVETLMSFGVERNIEVQAVECIQLFFFGKIRLLLLFDKLLFASQ